MTEKVGIRETRERERERLKIKIHKPKQAVKECLNDAQPINLLSSSQAIIIHYYACCKLDKFNPLSNKVKASCPQGISCQTALFVSKYLPTLLVKSGAESE